MAQRDRARTHASSSHDAERSPPTARHRKPRPRIMTAAEAVAMLRGQSPQHAHAPTTTGQLPAAHEPEVQRTEAYNVRRSLATAPQRSHPRPIMTANEAAAMLRGYGQQLGTDLSNTHVTTGQHLGTHKAEAQPGTARCADASPTPSTIAHEAVHLAQFRQGKGRHSRARAEREADALAPALVRGEGAQATARPEARRLFQDEDSAAQPEERGVSLYALQKEIDALGELEAAIDARVREAFTHQAALDSQSAKAHGTIPGGDARTLRQSILSDLREQRQISERIRVLEEAANSVFQPIPAHDGAAAVQLIVQPSRRVDVITSQSELDSKHPDLTTKATFKELLGEFEAAHIPYEPTVTVEVTHLVENKYRAEPTLHWNPNGPILAHPRTVMDSANDRNPHRLAEEVSGHDIQYGVTFGDHEFAHVRLNRLLTTPSTINRLIAGNFSLRARGPTQIAARDVHPRDFDGEVVTFPGIQIPKVFRVGPRQARPDLALAKNWIEVEFQHKLVLDYIIPQLYYAQSLMLHGGGYHITGSGNRVANPYQRTNGLDRVAVRPPNAPTINADLTSPPR